MKTNINTNGAAASNGKNNINVVRKAFGGFSQPQTLAEGEYAAVITSIEQVTGTDSKNKPVHFIEMTVSVESQSKSYSLKRSYNMGENGRGAALLINDYDALFGTKHNRYELYKLDCGKLVNLPVTVVVSHNNATKVPVPVIKEFMPVVQTQPEVAAESATVAAEVAAEAAPLAA